MLAPLAGLALWCRIGPVSYARLVGGPVWRRRVRRRVRRMWPLVMEAVGLTRRIPTTTAPARPDRPVVPRDRVVGPGLHRLRWRDGQLVATPRLLVGQTVENVETAAERLRVAVDAQRCRVMPNAANTACRIVWSFGDLLREPFDATVPTVDAELPILGRLRMGRTEDGTPWLLDVRVSTLVAGTSGSGKASLVWSLMFGLAPAIRAGLVEVHGIDLKGGMEFAMGRPLFTRYAQTPEVAVVLLEEAAGQMTARAQRLAGVSRSLEAPTTGEPLVFVVVDELAALVAYQTDRDLLRRAETALALILSQGRAVGFFVFGFLQDPRKETIKMRHLFPQSFGLRLRDREEVAMVLSDGAVHAGAACHKIPRSTPGVGYVLGEDNRPVRVRAGYVSDAMITTAAARFPAANPRPVVVPEPVEGEPVRRPRSPRPSSSARAARQDAAEVA
ncbi:MAG TPA: FtsK/SpoIIIE domain-containing protein [Dermatophilaceae bacterium]|nr:FtsK/SpoIIIE domain-containing protein [Dermatophilaceae bacterium]